MWPRWVGRRCPFRLIEWVGFRDQRYRSNGTVGLEWQRNVRERGKFGSLGRLRLDHGNELRLLEHERCRAHQRHVERKHDEQRGPRRRPRRQ
jgi:hypothetical protein